MSLVSGKKRKINGRIPLAYWEKCKRGKWDEEAALAEYLKLQPFEKVMNAVCKMLRDYKDDDIAYIIKVMIKENANVKEMKEKLLAPKEPKVILLTPQDGLSLLLDCKLSKHQYRAVQNKVNACGHKVLPSYDKSLQAKAHYRPNNISINTDGTCGFVPLKQLLHHTVQRIVEVNKEQILKYQQTNGIQNEHVTLLGSYGMDGSTGHSMYKMKMGTGVQTYDADTSLFTSSFVPLQIERANKCTLWKNPTPQSPRFCRPIRVRFIKENTDVILGEKDWIEDQIRELEDSVITLGPNNVLTVSYKLYLTIIDGKVLAAITGTRSHQTCCVCGKNPKDFNSLDEGPIPTFLPIDGRLKYGISPLHCWIRFLEFLLNLAYRLQLKTWRVTKEKRPILQARKSTIQKEIMEKMGLKVDYPSGNGAGSTNDGNTSRRAFKDFKIFAEILGIDATFVEGLRTILICLASQQPINAERFKTHCKKMTKLYLENYAWFYLPATVHKVLAHGSDIIKFSALPVGMLGEDAAESRNKNYKEDREKFTRKHSRSKNMEDLFNRAIDCSDPIIALKNTEYTKKEKDFSKYPKQVLYILGLTDEIEICISNGSNEEALGDTLFIEQLEHISLNRNNEHDEE